MYYAWYSPKQEQIRRQGRTTLSLDNPVQPTLSHKTPGCVYWKDSSGHRYQTTMVTKSKDHGCNTKYIDDLVYQGQVTVYDGICRW